MRLSVAAKLKKWGEALHYMVLIRKQVSNMCCLHKNGDHGNIIDSTIPLLLSMLIRKQVSSMCCLHKNGNYGNIIDS